MYIFFFLRLGRKKTWKYPLIGHIIFDALCSLIGYSMTYTNPTREDHQNV
jgi:hypothetical protein